MGTKEKINEKFESLRKEKTGSLSGSHAILVFLILLPQVPKRKDYRHARQYLTRTLLLFILFLRQGFTLLSRVTSNLCQCFCSAL